MSGIKGAADDGCDTLSITKSTMLRLNRMADVAAYRAQFVIGQPREGSAGIGERIGIFRAEGNAQASQFSFEEVDVEYRVVGDQRRVESGEKFEQLRHDGCRHRLARNHRIGDVVL